MYPTYLIITPSKMASNRLCRLISKCSSLESRPLLTFARSFPWKNQSAAITICVKNSAKAPTQNFGKKKELVVETDPKKLCSRLCGGNIYKEGEDPVLGPDSDYPDWLWNLRLEKGQIPLEQLSEDDPKYWRTLKRITMKRNQRLNKAK